MAQRAALVRAGICVALVALALSIVTVWRTAPAEHTASAPVQLRFSTAPMTGPANTDATTTIKWPVVPVTDPRPFDPCFDIPSSVIAAAGLDQTPPAPEEGLRCRYDSRNNYQLAVEAVVWRTYEDSLPADGVETTIAGHRAAEYNIMKPTDWNNQWWVSCMITFKTSYGVVQQSLYYASQKYSPDGPGCLVENRRVANILAPAYKF
ncbi:hypothetical protein MABM_02290 [Mycobacteroides abscessus]|uniref:DUF3558 domain-containing protein n=1 Tax=Mycobacteroides abscessus subsp. bolletii 50594 TaxID=1303024 RepID=A0AB33ACX9_9MYCO|nr:DUF3558 family protein [Mycobacteroides abscessus]AGM29662.1 hypothetical protein MASS_3060 [Mycobacteroides abscessus subsp. bolletii 50594]BBZ80313.1 hypothetical protein MABM_02290 [Mycobacteroides abscessus]